VSTTPSTTGDFLSAAMLRWFTELAQQGVFTTDAQLVVQSWNPWLESNTGHPAAAVVGRPLFESFPDLLPRGFEAYYRAALGGEIKVLAQTFHRHIIPVHESKTGVSAVRQSGRIAPLEWAGTIIGTVTVIEDVTERIATERELRTQIESSDHARALAEEAVRVKDEFLATLSHEIRTPLNAVVGWTKILLARGGDPALLARGLEVIDRNSTAQIRLIDDMLDTARIMTGKLRLEKRPVDLARVALAAIDVVAPTAAAKNVEIHSNFEEPSVMAGDPDRLQQITWNLLVNAIKFTGSGGHVRVTVGPADGLLTLTVTDTGEGMSAEFLPQIFERFRQADPSASRRHSGLGIGLSLVRQLVELHGGRIAVTSTPGVGSTFTVTFPSRPDLFDGTTRPDEPMNGSVLASVRVVVVDAESSGREMLTLALEQYGARVTAVGSGADALELLADAGRHDLPHAIVSDVHDAADAELTLIRDLGRLPRARSIPVIGVTEYDDARLKARVLAAGFHTHLAKPLSPNALAMAVRQLVTLV
jgi:PAS domain S-box-containing protein